MQFPTFSLKTFGCRLNRAESAKYEALLLAAGLCEVPFGTPSDVVIMHTCAITATAERECLRILRHTRAKQPSAWIVITGCAVEAGTLGRLVEMGADDVVVRPEKEGMAARILSRFGMALPAGISKPDQLHRALLKVQDGCSFFCTYCIVPYTRGAPASRPFEACLEEGASFIRSGYREIVLTGCNIACYVDKGRRFPDLVEALMRLPGLGRLRIGSLEPGMGEERLIPLMAGSPHLCNFLHLPIQSGDEGVLKRMGRKYTVERLRRSLDLFCEALPDIGLGADFITGFPGESEAAFRQTLALVEAYPFSNLHVFPYSERPGTPAVNFEGSIPVAERRRRAQALIEVREEKRARFARHFIGKEIEVLVERVDARGIGTGWSAEYLPCRISGMTSGALGTLVKTTPQRVEGETLHAAIQE